MELIQWTLQIEARSKDDVATLVMDAISKLNAQMARDAEEGEEYALILLDSNGETVLAYESNGF